MVTTHTGCHCAGKYYAVITYCKFLVSIATTHVGFFMCLYYLKFLASMAMKHLAVKYQCWFLLIFVVSMRIYGL